MSFINRRYPSGSQKRLKRKHHENELKRMKGSLQDFLISNTARNSDSESSEARVQTTITENITDFVPENVKDIPTETEGSTEQDRKNEFHHKEVVENECELFAPNTECESVSNENLLHSSLECNKSLMYPDDPALWPAVITEEMREYFTERKPNQHISEIHNSKKFCADKERILTEHTFYRHKQNEKIKRDWLVYSPSKAALFCYVCKLFSSSHQALCDEGFSNWKNVAQRLKEHENSQTHRDSVCKLSLRTIACNRIDKHMVEEYQKECKYWRNVLYRVVATVKFLAERGLPLFGDNETVGSVRNGNFLGCLELIGKFDPFMAEHLSSKGNPGKGCTNYLSSTSVTEFLQLMSEKVLQHILIEVRKAKYFGLIVDSSPDISHIDQLSIVVRYVNEEGESQERFLKFLPVSSHGSLSLSTSILNFFDKVGLDILNCRGQSYDNANNMAGQYSGLQARIKEISPLADYVPCSAHSLNLVGTNAVDCCHQAVSFFSIVQGIYNFFSVSTHRWQILQQQLLKSSHTLKIKSLSNTRWSAEADATKALRKGYLLIRQALHDISKDNNETATTRHEARGLHSKMCKFEVALMTIIWDTILQRINSTNKCLQNTGLDISSLVPVYDSLIKFINVVRENLDAYETEAKELVDEMTYSIQREKTISRRLDPKSETECHLSPKESFRIRCHNVICDALIVQLHKRMEAYSNLEQKFGFLYNTELSIPEILMAAEKFQKCYSTDIDDNFPDEFLHFGPFLKQQSSPVECLKKIKALNISHTFPNVEMAFRILLTLPVSNCSSERSFSVLKRIKNRLRSTLNQENLQAFSILSIESDITSKMDFDDLINDFALQKSRRKPL